MILESDFLNDRQVEDLQMMAEIVNALAISDGFSDLDSCLKKHPKRLSAYTRYAAAALQAMRHVQGHPVQPVDEAEEIIGTIRTIIQGGCDDS